MLVPHRLPDVDPMPVQQVVRDLPAPQAQGHHLWTHARHEEGPQPPPLVATVHVAGRLAVVADSELRSRDRTRAWRGPRRSLRSSACACTESPCAESQRDGVTDDQKANRFGCRRRRLARARRARARRVRAAGSSSKRGPDVARSSSRGRREGRPDAASAAGTKATMAESTTKHVTPAGFAHPIASRSAVPLFVAASAPSPDAPVRRAPAEHNDQRSLLEAEPRRRHLSTRVAAAGRSEATLSRARPPRRARAARRTRGAPCSPRPVPSGPRPVCTQDSSVPACRLSGACTRTWTSSQTQAPAWTVGSRPSAAVMKAAA